MGAQRPMQASNTGIEQEPLRGSYHGAPPTVPTLYKPNALTPRARLAGRRDRRGGGGCWLRVGGWLRSTRALPWVLRPHIYSGKAAHLKLSGKPVSIEHGGALGTRQRTGCALGLSLYNK